MRFSPRAHRSASFASPPLSSLIARPVRRLLSRRPLLALAAALLFFSHGAIVSTQGRAWYVAPNGSASNPGTADRPLDLVTALSDHSPARPGDTIWVRGGVYRGQFTSWISGTPGAPIVVRAYPGERATLDNRTDCAGYVINGNYTWHWGLEVTSSGTIRRTPYAESDCGNPATSVLDRGLGMRNNGTGTKLINNVIHDTQNGISNWGTWDSNPDFEAYGNLIYYNGWEQTPIGRGHGHGFYTLSKPNGPTVLRDNIVHSQFSQGIRMGDDGVFNPIIEGNISYLNGAHMYAFGGGRNIYVGGSNDKAGTTYSAMTGVVLRNNYTYHRTNQAPYAEGVNLGLWWAGASGAVMDNYIAGEGGGDALKFGYDDTFVPTRCTGNTVYGPVSNYVRAQCGGGNTFYSSKPPANAVFVRPNQYERGRANIAIYNWQLLPSVAVNLGGAGLAQGQAYEVRDAMNFYGNPVARGTFSSATPTVSIPMNGLQRAPMGGESDVTPAYRPQAHSAPEFGAFIVLPVSGGSAAPVPTPGGAAALPGQPSHLFAHVEGNQVALSWRAPIAGGPVSEYVLQAGAAPGDTSLSAPVGLQTSAAVPNVPPGRYFVRVVARNAAGVSAASNEVAVSVGCQSRPRRPEGLAASVNGQFVTLSWSDPDGCSGTRYRLGIGTVPGQSNLGQVVVGASPVTTTAQPGTYFVRMASESPLGMSDITDEIEVTVGPSCSPPPFAVALTASVNGSRVALNWSPTNAGAAVASDSASPVSYVLEVGNAPGQANLISAPLGRVTQLATDAPPGTYYVRVRAVNGCGAGPASNEQVVTVG